MAFEPYTPTIKNPYPDEWREVTGFSFESHLYLARAKDAIAYGEGRESEYVVSAEYCCSCTVDGKRREILVPSGMLTDLASVPRAGRLIVNRVGPHLEAAIVHDFLFLAWQDLEGRRPTDSDFRFANEVMLQAMIAAKVKWVPRNLIYAAITSFVGRQIFKDPNPGTRYVRVPSPGPGPIEPDSPAPLVS